MAKSFGGGSLKRLLSLVLGVALALGILPGLGARVALAEDTYTITVNGAAITTNADLRMSYECARSENEIKVIGYDGIVSDAHANNIGAMWFLAIKVTGEGQGSLSYEEGAESKSLSIYCTKNVVPVSSVSLDPGVATVAVGGAQKLTATIEPDDATNKKVVWRANGDDGEIGFYSDEACTKPVEQGTATDLLTVYIKGVKESSGSFLKIDVDSVSELGKHASCYVTVSKAIAVPARLAANDRTYDATEKPLVTVDASTLVGGEMQYALGTDATTAPTEGWGTDIPNGINAGTYYVWYKAVGDATHADSEAKSVTVTIAKKDEPEPEPQPADVPPVSVTAHVQRKGTLAAVSGGAIAGTTGKRLRMESIKLTVPGASEAGGIEYRGHVQRKGWEKSWARDGATAGTEGKSRRMEAIQVRLWGDMAEKYDVYYRVHSQRLGWMGWAKNGDKAGTEGMSRRAEAIQVVLVAKDAPAPATDFQGAAQAYAKAFAKK